MECPCCHTRSASYSTFYCRQLECQPLLATCSRGLIYFARDSVQFSIVLSNLKLSPLKSNLSTFSVYYFLYYY